MKKFLFCLAFVFGVISLLWSYTVHRYELEIPFMGHINADIRVNVETPSDKILFVSDGIEQSPYIMKTKNTYVSYEKNNVYMRLEGKNFPIFCAAFSQFATVSMVRTNRDVLVARIVKRNGISGANSF